jgi:dTDP-glucose 4,6-dehydratase
MSILEFARNIIDITGADVEIVFKPLPEDDPKVRQPDISRARSVLEWDVRVDFATGIRRTVEFFRDNPHELQTVS